MQLGARGEALIKSYEKLALVAYRKFPGEPWTLGWGRAHDIVEGQTCTPDEAETWFQEDTADAVSTVNKSLTVPVTQNQFDALVSFAYNAGDSAESHSTLVRYVNAGRNDLAAGEFTKWDHVNGQVVLGLLRRREAEQALFQSA